jgi:hypothetical protein
LAAKALKGMQRDPGHGVMSSAVQMDAERMMLFKV